jgi:hypothetical protein
MEKIIKIGKTEVKLNNNVAWTMEYRDQFGKDIVPALMPVLASIIEGASAMLGEADNGEIDVRAIASAFEGRSMEVLLPLFQVEFVDVIINVTWAMAKCADETIDPPKKWVKQFDVFPLDTVLPAVYDVVVKGFVSSKNLKRLKNIVASLKSLQPSHSTTLSSQDSKED